MRIRCRVRMGSPPPLRPRPCAAIRGGRVSVWGNMRIRTRPGQGHFGFCDPGSLCRRPECFGRVSLAGWSILGPSSRSAMLRRLIAIGRPSASSPLHTGQLPIGRYFRGSRDRGRDRPGDAFSRKAATSGPGSDFAQCGCPRNDRAGTAALVAVKRPARPWPARPCHRLEIR
jgi:hypothetical protein